MFGIRKQRHEVTSKSKLVGVTGVGHGVGVTHMSLIAASYLSSALAYRVAYAEVSHKSRVLTYLGDEPIMHGRNVGYRFKGVDYFPAVCEEGISELETKRYDVVICDLGVIEPNKRMLVKWCDRLIVIGSLQLWRYEEYREYMRDYYIKGDTLRAGLFGLYLKDEEKRRFEKEFNVPITGVPYMSDPYRLKKEDITAMQRITAGWL